MTHGAADVLVRSLQRKLRLVVIKWLGLLPFDHGMTIVAALTQSALMRFDLLVTFSAKRRGLAKPGVLAVATVTGHAPVGIDQFEICKIMVEGLAVELTNVGTTTLVLGMTTIARFARGRPIQTMEPLVGRTISCGVLVAIETEFAL